MDADDLFRFFKVTRTVVDSTCKLVVAQLRGLGAEGADDHAEPVAKATVTQPMGVFARPVLTATLQGLALYHGDEVLVIALQDKTKLPVDPGEGGVTLYCPANPGFGVKIAPGGTVAIDANGDIVLNGGGARVGRVGDPVHRDAAMTTWMNAVGAAFTTLGVPVPPLVGNAIGTINDGAPNVKA